MVNVIDELDAVRLALPDDAVLIDERRSAERAERRWFCGNGMFLTLAAVPAAKAPDLDPLSLDLVVGETLEHHVLANEGVVESMAPAVFEGALAGRLSRARMVSSGGEPVVLFLGAALSPARAVVVLQVVVASGAEELLRADAIAIVDSLAVV